MYLKLQFYPFLKNNEHELKDIYRGKELSETVK